MPGRYYHTELTRLKQLAIEFAAANPTLVPMLGGPTADPDAERLLEGVAFKTALLRQKLAGDLPSTVNELTRHLLPHYLQPFPAATVVAFTPQPSFGRSLTIPAGTQLAAVPVDGTSCTFATTWDIEVQPLLLTDVTHGRTSARATSINLTLELHGLPLCQWRPEGFSFFITGDYVTATDLTMLLHRHLRTIIITPETGGEAAVLTPDCLELVGFDPDHALIPYPSHAFPGYRLLQEFFNFPEKHLFVKINGLERWASRGTGNRFTISLELDGQAFLPTRVRRENFVLHAVPAINSFAHEADPIRLDHRACHHLLRPSGVNPAHYQICSVDKVTGFTRQTGRQRRYPPFELFNPANRDSPVFHASQRQSPLHAGFDIKLAVAYPPGSPLAEQETLSIQLTCSNGTLPNGLRTGDISQPVAGLPAGVSVRNIMPVTPGVLPPLNSDPARRLSTHLALNCLSLANAGNLRSLLELYIFAGNRTKAAVAANRKRIAGIEEVTSRTSDRWVSGVLMSGREVRVKLRKDHFAGPGDMYLFGCLLDRFFGYCAGPNTFTVLSLEETLKGDCCQWTPRLGRHPLL